MTGNLAERVSLDIAVADRPRSNAEPAATSLTQIVIA
jgi:hypothetical protein